MTVSYKRVLRQQSALERRREDVKKYEKELEAIKARIKKIGKTKEPDTTSDAFLYGKLTAEEHNFFDKREWEQMEKRWEQKLQRAKQDVENLEKKLSKSL